MPNASAVAFPPAGTDGNLFSTPDSAALSDPGDKDIRILVAPDVWNAGTTQVLLSKYSTSGHRSWNWTLTATNHLRLDVSADGVATGGNPSSSAIPGTVDGQPLWLRTTWVAATGSEAYQTSPDGVTWTTFSTRSTGTVLSIFDSDAAVAVGAQPNGASYLHGKVYYAEIRNGINGPVVAAFDPSRVTVLGTRNPTSFTGVQGNVWTATGANWDWFISVGGAAGTASQTLPALKQTAAGTAIAPHSVGGIAQTLPALTVTFRTYAFDLGPTPPQRTVSITPEDRVVPISPEVRVVPIEPESRVVTGI